MEPTRYELLAIEYHEKWQAAEVMIENKDSEIEALQKEVTELRRANYRLRDVIAESKTEKVCG